MDNDPLIFFSVRVCLCRVLTVDSWHQRKFNQQKNYQPPLSFKTSYSQFRHLMMCITKCFIESKERKNKTIINQIGFFTWIFFYYLSGVLQFTFIYTPFIDTLEHNNSVSSLFDYILLSEWYHIIISSNLNIQLPTTQHKYTLPVIYHNNPFKLNQKCSRNFVRKGKRKVLNRHLPDH